MHLQEFLAHVSEGGLIKGGSEHHRFMHGAAQEAMRTINELNTGYRSPEEVRALLTHCKLGSQARPLMSP